jgi:predicted AAA+ superfamily ATPase
MLNRTLSKKLLYLFTKFPVVAVQGPRQSGKTTLVRESFPHLPYVNFEDFNTRAFAKGDPKGFLNSYPNGLIIDEAQNVPDIFSYIQIVSDEKGKPGQYILTGSQQFMLQEKISQSLAGRIAITTLLPLSYDEIKNTKYAKDLYEFLYHGFYPRTYQFDIPPTDFFPNYIQSYIEKDIRQIKNVADLSLFQEFLKLCAGRAGQMLNLNSLCNDCGVSYATAKQWISLLETSFIVYILRPHHKNFTKRLVKTPKLYFYDTGVLCSLLNITSKGQLEDHYLRGAIFENFIINELQKLYYNQGRRPPLYFWRDKTGHEIDLLIEKGEQLIPIEIKSGQTITNNYFKSLLYWQNLPGNTNRGFVAYNGKEEQKRTNFSLINWSNLSSNLALNSEY